MQTRIGTSIDTAARLLNNGEVVGVPTETVYGLAGNALDSTAVARLFEVKERPFFDPLIIHLSEKAALERYARQIPSTAWQLIDIFWPGPLTIVLPKRSLIPNIVTSGLPTAGFRMPNHPVMMALLQQLDFPLAAPSANIFTRLSPTRAEHVMEQLSGRIPYILDGGPCKVGVESTIIKISPEGDRLWILRPGGISQESLEAVAGIPAEHASNDTIQAPGQFKRHYAPRPPLQMVDNLWQWIMQHPPNATTALVAFQSIPFHHPHLYVLSPAGRLDEAAARLFDILHHIEQLPHIQQIIAEKVPPHGLGVAINDRLQRAAHS